MKTFHATPGLFGGTNYYNESGEQVGSSYPGVVPGSWNHYGADGTCVGSSQEGAVTAFNHYAGGEYAGYSNEGLFGQQRHVLSGEEIGQTWGTDDYALIDLDF